VDIEVTLGEDGDHIELYFNGFYVCDVKKEDLSLEIMEILSLEKQERV